MLLRDDAGVGAGLETPYGKIIFKSRSLRRSGIMEWLYILCIERICACEDRQARYAQVGELAEGCGAETTSVYMAIKVFHP